MKRMILICVLFVFLLSGCFTYPMSEADQLEMTPQSTRTPFPQYCENPGMLIQQYAEVPECALSFGIVCKIDGYVIEQPPGCDLPDVYCIVGISQNGIVCMPIE